MSGLTVNQAIDQLKSQYSGGIVFGDYSLTAFIKKDMSNRGFFGSRNIIFLHSATMRHVAPACIAAPLVNLVAKNIIEIGAEKTDSSVPVRIFAPNQITISTSHLSIGKLLLVTEPQHGAIFCKKLTLTQHTEEQDTSCFEVVKSWVAHDDTEVEIVKV